MLETHLKILNKCESSIPYLCTLYQAWNWSNRNNNFGPLSSVVRNSDSMLETHLNGSKHLKKMKQLGQEDVSTGTNSTSTDYSQPPLFPIEFEAWQIRIPSQLEKEKQQQNSRKGNT